MVGNGDFWTHQQYPSPQDPLENSQQLEAFRGGILREQFVKVLARLAPGHIRNEFPKPQWVLKSGKPHNTTITKHKQQVLRLKVLLFWQGASKNRSKLIVTKAFCFFPESLLQGLVVQACRKSNCPEYNEANQTNSSSSLFAYPTPYKKNTESACNWNLGKNLEIILVRLHVHILGVHETSNCR